MGRGNRDPVSPPASTRWAGACEQAAAIGRPRSPAGRRVVLAGPQRSVGARAKTAVSPESSMADDGPAPKTPAVTVAAACAATVTRLAFRRRRQQS